LLDVVHDPTPEVRSATIEALSHFYDSSITAALRSALSDPMRSVRRAAVIALGIQAQRLDADSLVADLTPLLRDLHFEVCRQAVIALGRVGTETAVAALSQLLQSTQTPIELQVETVRALSWIGSASAMTVIRACFDSALPAYLPSITGTAAARDQLQREIVAILGRVESATAKIMALQILQQLLETAHPVSDTSPGKQQIAVSLGHLRDANAIPALIQLAADADLIVRLHAIAALKQTPSAYEQLQQRWSEIGSRCQDADDLKTGVEIALQEW
jgi:HEAT repeat protein